MSWFKRIGFFLITNMAIMLMVTVILKVLGVEPYLNSRYQLNYQSLMIYCFIWGSVGAFISLMMSKWMAKSFYGVKIVDDRGQYARLVHKVHQFSKAAGLSKMPEVGVYDSPDANAFATGPSKNNSLVAVSTGLLRGMTEDEVDGVLAHEVGHIANGDMVTMTIVQAIVNSFVLFFAKIATFAISNLLRNDEDEGPGLGMIAHFVVEIAFQIIFGLIGSMIVSWFSRYREYRADNAGARLAGREKMIAALQRLQAQYESIPVEESQMAAMRISNRSEGLKALFSTHPPLQSRINALKNFRG